MANKPTQIIVHHEAPPKPVKGDRFDSVNDYHRRKWNFRSSLGYYVGYHYFIEKTGKVRQARAESEAGAHCKEKFCNYTSIGICLAGNFDIELPTPEQIESLKKLLKDICNRYKIPASRIFPHRFYAPYKSCYGKLLANDWASKLLIDIDPFIIKWEGRYIMDVERGGAVYLVQDYKRKEIKDMILIKKLLASKQVTGFTHANILRIPSA
jgi:hypothetical protein